MERSSFSEMSEMQELIPLWRNFGRVHEEGIVDVDGRQFPIYSFTVGPQNTASPILLLTGGVHGLERIGTNVVLSYLKTITQLLQWDQGFHHILEKTRLAFIPIINPGGMFRRTRSNPNGIDLMRNAPVEAKAKNGLPLIGGHRVSSKLPWYRGVEGAPMEGEIQAVQRFLIREVFTSKFAISLDVHSGFGLRDRLWIPFAHTKSPCQDLAEFVSLKALLDSVLPYHIYKFEPQSLNYVTHGDFWDYFYLQYQSKKTHEGRFFLSMALEIGSWIWIKKNPSQIFTVSGMFNPMLPHRLFRTLRRHLLLFDFLMRAVHSYNGWALLTPLERKDRTDLGMKMWYQGQIS